MSGHDDFEREVEPGLPERLPPGEQILWRGAPDWRALARHAFHVRGVACYFGLLGAWFGIEAWYDGVPLVAAAATLAGLAGLTAGALGLLALLAWLSARETVYTVTNRRIVVRFGVALRMTLNVPFTVIEHAGLKLHRDGTGDIPLALSGTDRVSYLVLWPHARPWRLRRPEIMLRCIPAAAAVADRLAIALRHAAPAAMEQAPAVVDRVPGTRAPAATRLATAS